MDQVTITLSKQDPVQLRPAPGHIEIPGHSRPGQAGNKSGHVRYLEYGIACLSRHSLDSIFKNSHDSALSRRHAPEVCLEHPAF